MRFRILTILALSAISPLFTTFAQQSNPVERQVANPITDTPNINPVSSEQTNAAPKPKKKPSFEEEGGDGQVVVYSEKQVVEGAEGKRIVHHTGNVDVHYGIYRLQA